jgi:hypothetical protein
VTIRSGGHADHARLSRRRFAAIDVIPSSWYADYPSPSSFVNTFLSCRSATAGGFWCDPGLDRLLRRAHALEATDLARADAVWARADRRAVDRAAWVPLVNPRELDFVSERLRDYRYDPPLGFLAAQASLATPGDPAPAAGPTRNATSRAERSRCVPIADTQGDPYVQLGRRSLRGVDASGSCARSLRADLLGERYEDDSGGGVELGGGDLNHRGLAIEQLKDAAARAGGRVVYRLEQLDAVEGGDLSRHGTGTAASDVAAWSRA